MLPLPILQAQCLTRAGTLTEVTRQWHLTFEYPRGYDCTREAQKKDKHGVCSLLEAALVRSAKCFDLRQARAAQNLITVTVAVNTDHNLNPQETCKKSLKSQPSPFSLLCFLTQHPGMHKKHTSR